MRRLTAAWRGLRRRTRWLIALGAVALGGIVAFLAAYLILFSGTSPAPLTLTTPSSAASPALTAAQLPGAWKVSSGSVAGYRVREQLAILPAPSDAVGRTSSITGTLTLSGTAASLTAISASFSVDVSTLTSDRQMRDDRIHEIGLESDRYPTATFTLAAPIALPPNAASGAQIAVPAAGDLTIHGTTKRVTIPLTARLTGSQVEVQGSLTFPFEMFGMTPPNIAGFVSVQDSATLEFDLHFVRA